MYHHNYTKKRFQAGTCRDMSSTRNNRHFKVKSAIARKVNLENGGMQWYTDQSLPQAVNG